MDNSVKQLIQDEQGLEIVEFVALFPLILLTFAIAWQFVLVGYTGLLASSAAREGARSAATHEDVNRAVDNASPGFDGRRQWAGLAGYPCSGNNPVTIQVKLQVPSVVHPFIGSLNAYPWVTAKATVRCEPPPG